MPAEWAKLSQETKFQIIGIRKWKRNVAGVENNELSERDHLVFETSSKNNVTQRQVKLLSFSPTNEDS
jgi:hypothetical protein